MGWALKGITEPLQDKLFPLKAGLTLGRQGEVLVNNAKASSVHAQILGDEIAGWKLEDNQSKNGTRLDGQRITCAPLHLGSIFFIGEQGFEVVELLLEVEKRPEKAQDRVKRQRYWHERLASFLEANRSKFGENQQATVPLEPAVVLEFKRGVQINSRWVVGYGPRRIGGTSLDLPILEPGAPAVCFELLPTPAGNVIKTNHADLVQINGQSLDSHTLRVGDTIRILETLIEVGFAK